MKPLRPGARVYYQMVHERPYGGYVFGRGVKCDRGTVEASGTALVVRWDTTQTVDGEVLHDLDDVDDTGWLTSVPGIARRVPKS